MHLTYLCLRTKESISLAEELGRGAEGIVFKTSKPNYLAKVYSSKANQERSEKLRVMLDSPPPNPSQSERHTSIAWPVDILIDQEQNCVGFLMPEIRNSKPLISVYSLAKREKEAVGFNWLYLHTTALNISLILKSLHRSRYTVGDLKPENFRVNDRALVSIVDTDSFQVEDISTGKIYYSSMGSDEYTPHEMYGKDLSSVKRSDVQDRFGLAIVIWLLIFGKHPFSGKWKGSGDELSINENIRYGYWVYGYQSKIKLADSATPINVVHPELQKLFYQCFSVGHHSPYDRPTASEWCEALKNSINDLRCCQSNAEHYFSTGYGKCYWCEFNALLNYDMFSVEGLAGSRKSTTTVPAPVPDNPILTTSTSPRKAAKSWVTLQPSSAAYSSSTLSSNKTTASTSQSTSVPVPSSSTPSSQSHLPTKNSSSSGCGYLALLLLFTIIAFGTFIFHSRDETPQPKRSTQPQNPSQTLNSPSQASTNISDSSASSRSIFVVQADDGYANLRSRPSTFETEIRAKIPNGTPVIILAQETNTFNQLWYKVQINGSEVRIGWIYSGLIEQR